MTIGVDRPPTGIFQARFLPSGDQLVGSPRLHGVTRRASALSNRSSPRRMPGRWPGRPGRAGGQSIANVVSCASSCVYRDYVSACRFRKMNLIIQRRDPRVKKMSTHSYDVLHSAFISPCEKIGEPVEVCTTGGGIMRSVVTVAAVASAWSVLAEAQVLAPFTVDQAAVV